MRVMMDDETDDAEADLAELYEERAAIMEYDGGLSREEAERLARVDVFEASVDVVRSGV